MGGNTLCLLSGLAMDSPSRMLPFTSSTASEMTRLLTVSFTISRAPRIGTPAWSSMPNVAENRASATLWNRGPNTGVLILIASMRDRPASVFLYRRKANPRPIAPRPTMYQ